MAAVMIGAGPHKGSHTAVAIDGTEEPLGELRVRASTGQAERLVSWAAAWPERIWAVEGAGGLGHLLAQQLVAAGERVPGVQPKLRARVRLLATGASNKYDPNDARSVAIAALRSPAPREVQADDHPAVLKVWAKRHRDLSRARNQVACRLHAVLCELDHFAAYDGTAPAGVSSGPRKIYRLSLRGNRRINHAIHMAAITQIRHRHSDGRAYYDKKIAEGKTHKEALRCLKRRISDAIYARLQADARRAASAPEAAGPGGQPGSDSDTSAAGLHPENRLFGQTTPEPGPTLRPATQRQRTLPPKPTAKKTRQNP